MRTTLAALLCCSPLVVGAQNQSSVNVYGVVDAAVVKEGGCDGDARCASYVSGGAATASRLGVKGREALGDNLAAVFTLEAGIRSDSGASDQNNRLFGRQAFVGLDGRFGALTLGRQYNLQYLTLTEVADPFQGGMAGNAANLVGYTVKRYDNTLKYSTPSLRGVTASAIYSVGESPFSNRYNRAYGATIGYANGPFTVSISHQRKNNPIEAAATVPPPDLSARNSLIAANVALGFGTVYAAYGHNKGEGSSPWDTSNPYGALAMTTPSTDSRDVLFGLSVPFGSTSLLASVIHKDDRSLLDRNARQLAVGLNHALSKRTAVYASFARIINQNGARYTVGNATEAGHGDRALTVGVRHAF
ncbi:porin [Oxalobacteraceae bacterium]|nr:porin [Oxalobacteraceae bacterium]